LRDTAWKFIEEGKQVVKPAESRLTRRLFRSMPRPMKGLPLTAGRAHQLGEANLDDRDEQKDRIRRQMEVYLIRSKNKRKFRGQ